MEVIRTVQHRSAARNTSGHQTQMQNWTETSNTRGRTWFVCLGIICVLLVIALIVMYIHLTADRDQMNKRYINIIEKCNKALNILNVNYSRLSDERKELEINLTSMSLKKLELEAELKKRNSQKDRYFISSEEKSWSDSRRFCKDRGGDLIIINTEEEQRYIYSIIEDNTWIGLSDIEKEGVMKWVDDSTPNIAFWISGEPNDAERNEDCVQMVSSYPLKRNWNDQPCTEQRRCIC